VERVPGPGGSLFNAGARATGRGRGPMRAEATGAFYLRLDGGARRPARPTALTKVDVLNTRNSVIDAWEKNRGQGLPRIQSSWEPTRHDFLLRPSAGPLCQSQPPRIAGNGIPYAPMTERVLAGRYKPHTPSPRCHGRVCALVTSSVDRDVAIKELSLGAERADERRKCLSAHAREARTARGCHTVGVTVTTSQ